MKNYLEIAVKASLLAGQRIMEIYETEDFSVEFKKDNSPLTKADKASHDIIESVLSETGIPVLSEEGKEIPFHTREKWKQLWIIDPIDGTKEFIKKNGEFTVNIALIEDQVPVLGVIYVPALSELYFADLINGSFKVTGIDHSMTFEEIHWQKKSLPLSMDREHYTVVASRSHLSEETEVFIKELELTYGTVNSISKGSSLKLCLVAEGAADCYPRFAPTMEWDTAAGHAICKYAGFHVEDRNTKKEMVYNRPELLNNWFLVQKTNSIKE